MLGKEKIIKLLHSIENGENIEEDPNVILKSIEAQFKTLEIIFRETFTNELSENFDFFSKTERAFQRISDLCRQLASTESLSSQTTALVCQTKLWIKSSKKDSQGLKSFEQSLTKLANDRTKVPHYRTIASNCLYELQLVYPELQLLDANTLVSCAFSTPTQTFFPQQAQLIEPNNEQLKMFLEKRFYDLCPFEWLPFDRMSVRQEGTIPNDPISLRSMLKEEKITKEEALSVVENPFSQFGLAPIIEEFPCKFNFTAEELRNRLDTKENAAAKCQLMEPVFSSIENTPAINQFYKEKQESSICCSVFNLARRLSPSDTCQFFKKYFPLSPHLDDLWIDLFEQQNKATRDALICFISQFPKRRATVKIMLIYDAKHSMPVLESATEDPGIISLLSNPLKKGGSLASIFAADTINNFSEKADEEQKKAIEDVLNHNDCVELEDPDFVPDLFLIKNVDIHTYDQTTTLLVLEIIPKVTLEPLIGVTFTASNPEYFEGESSYTVPFMIGNEDINIQMKAKKAGNTKIFITATFSTLDGKNQRTKLESINISTYQLLSSCDVEFEMAWAAPQESRVFLNMRMNSFLTLLRQTVFGLQCNTDNGKVESVVTTPDGQLIALYGVPTGNGVTISMKAPNIFFLTVIDGFLRTLH